MPFEPNEHQRAILAHDVRRHARILAGPGTGKSATLVALLNAALRVENPPRVRLLTFTRAATAELARKVLEHEVEGIEEPSTMHSFAMAVLLRNPGAGGLPQPLRLADHWEYKNVIKPSLSRRSGISLPVLEKLVQEMAANWQSLAQERLLGIDERIRALFLGAWGEHRERWGYTLLHELSYALRGALRDHAELGGVDYAALIVDEYQDLNACDLDVLRRIANRGCAIIGAGDDDQSIYSFRKAAPEGIRRFSADYPGAVEYPLAISHRCGQSIVEWSSYVIEGDPDRPRNRPRLTAANGSPAGEVALLSFRGEVAEARGVARLVKGLMEENIPASEILVLVRSDRYGFFSKPVKDELHRLGIPFSDPDAVDRTLGENNNRRLLAVCRLLTRRIDSLAWGTLLRLEGGIGPSFLDYVYDLAQAQHTQFGEALLAAYDGNFADGPRGASPRAHRLVAWIIEWLQGHQPPFDEPESRWGRWIVDQGATRAELTPTTEMQELLMTIDGAIEPGLDLDRYLGQVGPMGRDIALAQSTGVRIMTMAGAKGLTVRAAVVFAVEDGIVPRPDSDFGEERRLLYVAMTRAKEFLYCTWARRRRGSTSRAGRADAGLRRHSHLFDGGPVESEDGDTFIRRRFD
jgi:DNA helicase II / ATP-dependent DNA helicase PcrA